MKNKYRHSAALQVTQPHTPIDIHDLPPLPPVAIRHDMTVAPSVTSRRVPLRNAAPPVQRGPVPRRSAGYRRPPAALRQAVRPAARRSRRWWWLLPFAAIPALLLVTVLVFGLGFSVLYGSRVFPRVAVAGVSVGGLTPDQAANVLAQEWTSVTLREGERTWTVEAAALGFTLDAETTAARAFEQGRGSGPALTGLLQDAEIAPVLTVDMEQARATLESLAPEVAVPPQDARVQVVGGQVEAVPAQDGLALDVARTLLLLEGPTALVDGELPLATVSVAPAVTDVTPALAEAEHLLSHDLPIRVYDPVTGDIVVWTLVPDAWGTWLTVTPDGDMPGIFTFSVDGDAVAAYVQGQAESVFDPVRYLKVDEVVESIRAAVEAGSPAGYARVYHHDREYTVQPGESIISIAWDTGVPYPWIQQANPGVGALSAGQTIIIPSPDNFLEYPVVPDKRVVVSISDQHVWVYENGDLKWDWVASTGIADSPTWPGIYQIISHVPNAYAANWNLYMPDFLGVYRPIPGADFTNGFHGFPTRGGSQLLWTNSLGRRVTYGCILLSNDSVSLLYDWAEEGVVVEIRP